MELDKIIQPLRKGQLVVARSDTVYGIMASAENSAAVRRLHTVRQRPDEQGFIVLVDSVETVERLTDLKPDVKARLNNIWPKSPRSELGATSVILAASSKTPAQIIDRRTKTPTICLRVPNDAAWRQVLWQTGPLAAPSANLPDYPTACDVTGARLFW
jgi:L-threonylcarbamoyladenylate synthase